MVKINLICIGCPMGCPLTIEKDGSNILRVTGNTCPRGDAYARKELTNPTRIVTSTVAVEGSDVVRVSVKTRKDIPKDMIFACVKALKNVRAKAPVHIGDVVLENVAGTGVDVVATREVYSLSDLS